MGVIRRQFHGHRKESEDSYVTTEFAALWILPLWPVASYRVVRKEQIGANNRPGSEVQSKEIPIQWGQAIEGWLFLFTLLVAVAFLIIFAHVAHKFWLARLDGAMIYQLGWATLPGLRGLSCSEFRATPTTAPDNERGVTVELATEVQRDAFLRRLEEHFATKRFTNAADAFDTVKAYVLERAPRQ